MWDIRSLENARETSFSERITQLVVLEIQISIFSWITTCLLKLLLTLIFDSLWLFLHKTYSTFLDLVYKLTAPLGAHKVKDNNVDLYVNYFVKFLVTLQYFNFSTKIVFFVWFFKSALLVYTTIIYFCIFAPVIFCICRESYSELYVVIKNRINPSAM